MLMMKAKKRVRGCAQAICVVIALCSLPVHAQSAWKPDGAVEIIAPSGPGGGTDHTARVIQKILQERRLIEVPVTVANKPGGGSTVALNYLKQYTGNAQHVLVASAVLLTNHIVGRSPLSYTDFTPLALLQSEYVVLAVGKASPIASGQDLVARLKQDSTALSFAVGTTLGGANHSAVAALARAAGVDPRKLKALVFKSSSESSVALLGGHVDVVSASASQVLPHVRSGAMRLLAVSAPRRLGGELAAVPTLKEFGVNAEVNNFRILIGASELTTPQINYWDGVLAKLTQSGDWKQDLERNLFEPTYMGSRETRTYLDREYAELKALMKDMGLAK